MLIQPPAAEQHLGDVPPKKFELHKIHESIILIFSVNLPVICIHKFCKQEHLFQPPGEPREQHPERRN